MKDDTPAIYLRRTTYADLNMLFRFQMDQEGCRLAAFTPDDPADKATYLAKYGRLLNDPTVNNQTILVGDTIAGSIAKFEIGGDAEITYWIDRRFWGQGIATAALRSFLSMEKARPIFGRVAFDNFGSQRVLEKSGFAKIGEDRGFANARRAEIVEFIYRLI